MFRLSPDEVYATTSGAFKQIYSVTTRFPKHECYAVFGGHPTPGLFSISDFAGYGRRRGSFACAYSRSQLRTSGLAAAIEGGYSMKFITDFVQTPKVFAASETWVKLKSPEDAPAYMAGRTNEGSDYIKLLHKSGVTRGWDLPLPIKNLQASIVQAAHARGLKVVAHAMSLQETMDMPEVGVDGLAHTFIDTPSTDALINAYMVNNACGSNSVGPSKPGVGWGISFHQELLVFQGVWRGGCLNEEYVYE
ncbi:hypothetical protein F5X68DRAFT_259725 [Plectosphaerella plurivora]|uniref:Amidohydrolase-related domain-containing protein n=1 Tax=Plectosphaerella plurivora TaxID=936078 RepID=A0A9P8VHG7_9PEZI|nr:hypothetical protein F5X68DRAFT_259725 [Plectosphaerella plurivora]